MKKERPLAYIFLAYVPAILMFAASYLYHLNLERKSCSNCHAELRESPEDPVLRSGSIIFETRPFIQDFHKSKYAGKPSPDLDLAWHSLLEGSISKIDEKDLTIMGLDSVKVAGGGSLAQLSCFHELHCLKKIRQWTYKEYYVFPQNLTQLEIDEWPAHIDHCLEMLRQSIMCRGDTSLLTFKWIGDEGSRFPTIWDRGSHRCIKWDSLTSWAKENSVDITVPGILFDEKGNLYP